MLRQAILKMNAGGEGANSGGGGNAAGGAGSGGEGASAAGTGGGGGLLTNQGNGAAGGSTNNQQSPAQNSNNSNQNEIKYPENWKSGLPQELQESGALKLIHDIPSLAKSYVNAQKLVGADKIPVPSKHATPEEWRDVYHKLGLPQDVKDYKLSLPKEASMDQEFAGVFAQKAHELGILPQQAQELLNHFESLNQNAIQTLKKAQEGELTESVGKLQKEWGAAFDEKLNAARQAVSHFADKETMDYLDKSGLTNDTQLVRLFAKVSEVLKEDGLIKAVGSGTGNMTPAAAREAYGNILSNMQHPYYDKHHPNHKAAVDEFTRLFKMAQTK